MPRVLISPRPSSPIPWHNAQKHPYTPYGNCRMWERGGMKWEATRVRIKQPIASYFERHHHRREIFQTRWREGSGAWEWRPR